MGATGIVLAQSTSQPLAAPESTTGQRFTANLSAALETASEANASRTRVSQSKECTQWADFCATLGVELTLASIPDIQEQLNHNVFSSKGRDEAKSPTSRASLKDAQNSARSGLTVVRF